MRARNTPWSRAEKALFLAPLLLGLAGFALHFEPNAVRQMLGKPRVLGTTPDTELLEMVMSRDGSVLAAAGEEFSVSKWKYGRESGAVYLWDARTLMPLKSFAPIWVKDRPGALNGTRITSLTLSPNGKLIGITGRGGSNFTVYEVASQKMLWRSSRYSSSAMFSKDGRFVATNAFALYEARTGKMVSHWESPNGSLVQAFALSPDEKTVAWIGAKKKRPQPTGMDTPQKPDGKPIELRQISDGKLLRVLPHSEETESVSFSPDGSKIVSVTLGVLNTNAGDGSVVRCYSTIGQLLWQRDFRRSNRWQKHPMRISDATFLPDGRRVVICSGNQNRQAFILSGDNGREVTQLANTSAEVTGQSIPPAIAISPDGKRIFGRGRHAVIVWDLP